MNKKSQDTSDGWKIQQLRDITLNTQIKQRRKNKKKRMATAKILSCPTICERYLPSTRKNVLHARRP